MTDSRYLSTAEVAVALGVSVTTIKRWVDEGILPAHRTPGGHRKLLLADVLRITREGHFPCLDLARLHGAAGSPSEEPDKLATQLLNALRQGEGETVRNLLLSAYQAGVPLETLADTLIAPTMHRLGQEWEKGRIDVLHEHRATLQCVAALYQIKSRVEQCDAREGPRALGGGPEKDPYLLTNLLAELILRDAGWEVVNLGPNTPLRSFRRALAEVQPRLVWLSVTHLDDVSSFAEEYRELFREAARRGTAVVLGGQALTETLRASLPYTSHGDGLTHLAAFCRTLHPNLKRSGRGRPLGS